MALALLVLTGCATSRTRPRSRRPISPNGRSRSSPDHPGGFSAMRCLAAW